MDEPLDNDQLRDIFNRFAAKAAREFPQLSQSFLIYSPITNSIHGFGLQDPALEARLVEGLPARVAEHQKSSEGLAGTAGHFEGVPYVVLLKADHHAYTPRGGSPEAEVLRLLLHELGHHMAPGGKAHGAARGESIADTYSYLNDPAHGTAAGEKDWREFVLWQRSGTFVFLGDQKYFTAPVLEAAMDFAGRHPVKDLSPQEKANLAYRLAVLAQPDDAHLERLSEIFKPAGDAMDISAPAGFKALATIMFEDHGELSDEVYRIGRAVLKPALDQSNGVLETRFREAELQTLDFSGPDWDLLRTKIAARDQNMRGRSPMTIEATDMFLLGHFDKTPGGAADPAAYESKDHLAHLYRCYDTFGMLRRLQKSGTEVSPAVAAYLPSDVGTLSLEKTAQLAARIANVLPEKPKPAVVAAATP